MVTTDTGSKKISNNENWRNIFDAHNDSVDAYDDHIVKLDNGLAYVAVKSGNDWMLPSGKNASSGDYVIVNKVFGHATATLTGGSTAIVENTNWVAESAGALNSLNSNITTLFNQLKVGSTDSGANFKDVFMPTVATNQPFICIHTGANIVWIGKKHQPGYAIAMLIGDTPELWIYSNGSWTTKTFSVS